MTTRYDREIKKLVTALGRVLSREEFFLLNRLLDGPVEFRRGLPLDLAIFGAHVARKAYAMDSNRQKLHSERDRHIPPRSH